MTSIGTPTKKPALTPVQTGNTQLDNFINSVIQIHQVEEGLKGRGDAFKLDKKPTYRDLVALGLVIPIARGAAVKYSGKPVDGFKPGNGGDPVPDYSSPDVPTNVVATGGFGVIFIEWDDPLLTRTIPFFAHAEIWRSSTDDLGTATLLATAVSSIYSDKVGSGQTYYYWVRFVKDVKGTVVYGPFNATAGTEATSAEDVEYILDTLNGQITETHLYADLNTRINLVDAGAEVVGSVNARIAVETEARTLDVSNLTTSIQNEQTARENADDSLAQDILLLVAATDDNAAGILAEQTARSDADTALANSLTALTATVDDNTSAISAEQSARSDADTALSNSITSLSATVDDNTSAITAEQTARANADTALAQDITTLTGTVDDNTAAILAEQTARANADSALATDITALYAETGDNAAAILAEQTARSNADSALATDISNLGATVDDNSAAIIAEQTARADGDSALASSITALSSTVGDNTSSISTLLSTTNGMAAEFYVKTDVNGYVAGFGVYNDGPGASGFIVNADYFAVGKAGQTDRIPFIVATVNGVSRIALDAATFIPDATITTAKVGTAAITSAKIDSAAITEAKIATAAISSAKIQDAAITSAKIGFLQVVNAHIGNAAITSAKIGYAEIDTLRIAGDAVTVPSVITSSGGSISTSWTTALTWSAVWPGLLPKGASIQGNVNFLHVSGGGNTTYEARLLKDGVVISGSNTAVTTAFEGAASLTCIGGVIPTSSTETYTLQVKKTGPDTHQIGAKSILVMGVKDKGY